MKEQWKKLDSDAKLLVNVEEGRTLPIKIELPVSTVSERYGFCYRLHCISLRTIFLMVLLGILSWSAANLYTKYYSHSTFEPDKKVFIENEPLDEPVFNKLEFIDEVYKSIPKENIKNLQSNNVYLNTDIQPKTLFEDSSTTNIAYESTSYSIIHDNPVDKSTTKTATVDNSLSKINEIKETNKNTEQLNQELQNNLNKIQFSENHKSNENGENHNYLLFEQIFRDFTGVDSEKLKNIEKSNEYEVVYRSSQEIKSENENEMMHILKEFMNSIVTEKESSTKNDENNEDIKNQEKSNNSEMAVDPDFSANTPEVSENYQMISGPMSSFEHKSSEEKSQNSYESLQSSENIFDVDKSSDVLLESKENMPVPFEEYKNIEKEKNQNSQEIYETISGPMSSFEHKSSEEKSQNSYESLQSSENISDVGKSSDVLLENKEDTPIPLEEYKNIEQAKNQNSQEIYEMISGPMSSFAHKSSEEKSQNSYESLQSSENIFDVDKSSDVLLKNKENTSVPLEEYKNIEQAKNQNNQEIYEMISGPMSSFEHKSSEKKSQNSYESLQSSENIFDVDKSSDVLLEKKENTPVPLGEYKNIEQAKNENSQEIYEMVFGPISSFEHKSSEEKSQNSYESLQSSENISDVGKSSEVLQEINKYTSKKLLHIYNYTQNKLFLLMVEHLKSYVDEEYKLLSWYYSNKNNPNFITDNDKLKVFTAKMLFDTNIEDFNSDKDTVNYLLVINKHNQDLKNLANTQENIITPPKAISQVYLFNRLNIKGYMFDLYIKGLQSVEDISSAIEDLNRLDLHTFNYCKKFVNADKVNEENADKEQTIGDAPLDLTSYEDYKDKILNLKYSGKSIENTKKNSEESMPKTNTEIEEKRKSVIKAILNRGKSIKYNDQNEYSNSESNLNEPPVESQESDEHLEEDTESLFQGLINIKDYDESFFSYYGDEYDDN